MPGGLPESDFACSSPADPRTTTTTTTNDELIHFLKSLMYTLLSSLSYASRRRKSRRRNQIPGVAFTERFKYDVISSSLLSLTLSAPAHSTHSQTQSEHGEDQDDRAQLHNEVDHRVPQWRLESWGRHSTLHPELNSIPYSLAITLLSVVALAVVGITSTGSYIPMLALTLALILVATLFFFYDIRDWVHVPSKYDEEGDDAEKEDIQPPVSCILVLWLCIFLIHFRSADSIDPSSAARLNIRRVRMGRCRA